MDKKKEKTKKDKEQSSLKLSNNPEENYYQTIFRESRDALLILKNREFIDCNKAALEMIGYDDKSLFLSSKPSDLSPLKQKDGSDSFEKALEMMDIAVHQGSHRFEWTHIKADGSELPVEILLIPISMESDNELIYTTWRDMTKKQNVLEQAAVTEKKFKSLMHQSPYIIEIYDIDGLQIEVNKAYEEMWDFPAETTVNRFNVLKSEEVKKTGLFEYVLRAYNGEVVFVPIYQFNPTGKTEANGRGRVRWLNTKIYPLKDMHNNVFNIVITHEDVSERQQVLQDLQFSEERFRSLVETTSDFIWEVDETGSYNYVSPQVIDILGYKPEEILGKTPFDFMPEKDKKIISEFFLHVVTNRLNIVNLENKNIHKDGRSIVLETSGVPFKNAKGLFAGYRGIDRDITNRKIYEEQLVLTESVFKNSIEGIAVTDAQGLIQKVNNSFTLITGYSEEEVLGKNPRVLKSERHTDSFYKEMWDELIKNNQWSGEIWNRKKDGTAYPEWLSISAIHNDEGITTNYISVFHDISEKKMNEEKMLFLAFHDPLTKLPNRRLFYDRLNIAIESAKRSGKLVALFYLDIDNFKDINDTYGHPFGDELLCTVKNLINSICRKSDTLARYGGDEFVIVLNNIITSMEAVDFSERLINLFKNPVTVFNESIFTSISVGVTMFPIDGEDIVTLEKNADLALYKAKRAGKNQTYHYQEELKDLVLKKTRIQNGLRTSIDTFESFSLLYQPKIDIKNNKIHGVEALLRWQLEGVAISPDDFIPIAEETNLIIPLGRWIIRKAISDIMLLHQSGFSDLILSINLSSRQFNDEHMFDIIDEVLIDTGFDKSKLMFEITETTSVNDVESSVKIMEEFYNRGIALSLDDFGTGYSSLSYLKKFALTELKIDKSFIQDIPQDQNDVAICKTIINMAKSLNFNVVAEGVETQEQLDFLKENGCYIIQGYLFFKPMDLENLKITIKSF
ncbi:MAG: EAL domain-containing protein [Spirochaetaceae bacterium]|nr:EAL domain-containing protein [Spirochaetaceae bacterium]